ncbi:A disintegrin and metalloproteinase with thrombospondin motifs 9-like [Tubulanus polymorphus]|uniref:A disintegrin and metalloproteinase with thrombospondin motifs 9-like n=1 Tax=Tubulanus polymorphus TaxID=672921 RepID=UPI003DA48839
MNFHLLRVFLVSLLVSTIRCKKDSKKSQNFGALPNSAIRGPYLAEYGKITQMECAKRCMNNKDCTSFNFNDTLCQLSFHLPCEAADLDAADGTVFQYTCNGNKHCMRYDIRLFPNRCKHLVANGIKVDGNYQLFLNCIYRRGVTIYCHNMSSEEGPKEYISFYRENEGQNYAIISKPHYSANTSAYDLYSETYFRKCRIDLDTLEVVTDDFTFANTSNRLPVRPANWKPVNYGEAGSCSSTEGVIRISVYGTVWRVDKSVDWVAEGINANITFKDIPASRNNITIRCVGYCGSCRPNGPLKLAYNGIIDLKPRLIRKNRTAD